METQWLLEHNSPFQPFAVLPPELRRQIFRHLPTPSLNSIRRVTKEWDSLIKEWFGTAVILNNTNCSIIPGINGCGELQVRNLTTDLQSCDGRFSNIGSVKTLEMSGMCQSTNLVFLLEQLSGLETLKLDRLYLETDRRFEAEVLEPPENIQTLSFQYLKNYKFQFSSDRRNARAMGLYRTFTLTTSDILVLRSLDALLTFDNLRVLDLRHVVGSGGVREGRNGDVIHWWGGGVHSADFEDEESIKWVSKLVIKVLRTGNLKELRVDNCPVIVEDDDEGEEDDADMEAEEDGEEEDEASIPNAFEVLPRNLDCLEVDGGMLGNKWEQVLQNLSNVKELKLVILDLTLLPNVKNLVKRSLETLEELEITVSTMHNIVTGTADPEAREVHEFDLAFLKPCKKLRRLVLKYAGMKLNFMKLPMQLEEVQVCGEVLELEEFVKQSSSLKRLNLELSGGFFENFMNENDRDDLFSSIENVETLFFGAKNKLETLVLAEYGARKGHKNIKRRFCKMAGINIILDEKVCKLRRIVEQEETTSVSRITIKRTSV